MILSNPPATGNNAKPALACHNCSIAKAKCIPQPKGGSPCGRCSRLKKECVMRERKARKKRAPNPPSNTVQLEQKIESLVTLLSAAQGTAVTLNYPTPSDNQSLLERPPQGQQAQSFSSFSTTPEADSLCKRSWDPHLQPPDDMQTSVRPLSNLISNNPATIRGGFQSDVDLPVRETYELFNIFIEQFAGHFPFIIISHDMSSDDLRVKQPWLHRTIIMLASYGDPGLQHEMGKQIVSDLAIALLIKEDKSLDMLQSLIVFNTWSYYFSEINPKLQSTSLLHLTLALLFELGLNKPIRRTEGIGEVLNAVMKEAPENMPIREHSLQERRALLSCYILTSVSSYCVKTIEGLQHSAYIETCCQALVEAGEYESDLILVACTRLQGIVESIHQSLSNNGSATDGIKAPMWMHVKSLRAHLQSYWMSLPPNLQQNTSVLMHYHTAQLFLYEPCIQRSVLATHTDHEHSQRLDMLYSLLLTTKMMFDIFQTLPLDSYAKLSVINMAQQGHAFSIVIRLSLLDVVGWDLGHVRETVNLSEMLDHLAAKFEAAGTIMDRSQHRQPPTESYPTGYARVLRRVKVWYEAKVGAAFGQNGRQDRTGISGMDDMFNLDRMDYLDTASWQDIMSDCNFMQLQSELGNCGGAML